MAESQRSREPNSGALPRMDARLPS